MHSSSRRWLTVPLVLLAVIALGAASAELVLYAANAGLAQEPLPQVPAAPQTKPPFKPEVGQHGKDVVWVPTPQALVDKMLDMAKVTPEDLVMDLGSGDGITVISAAKRGARAIGIEYNPDMVDLSRANAEKAGVTAQGDLPQRRPLRNRPVGGDGHHDVPAAADQHEAAAEDPRPEARHAHRLELVHDGGLGRRRDRQRRRRMRDLVHGVLLDRAGEDRRQVEDADRRVRRSCRRSRWWPGRSSRTARARPSPTAGSGARS